MKKFEIILIGCLIVFLGGCNDNAPTCTKTVKADLLSEVDQTKLASDISIIDSYLLSKGISAQSEPNGVRYVISSLGTGSTPCLENRISVIYSGRLLNSGLPFDSTTTPVTFTLSGLILGWKLVLPIIPAGSKVTLYIPSGYAYGTSVAAGGKIPANSNLVFEIEFVKII